MSVMKNKGFFKYYFGEHQVSDGKLENSWKK